MQFASIFSSTSSPIQTLTVGPGITPGQPLCIYALWFTDLEQNMFLTVGRELHPAPKIKSICYCKAIIYEK